jgi:hypothetical protein
MAAKRAAKSGPSTIAASAVTIGDGRKARPAWTGDIPRFWLQVVGQEQEDRQQAGACWWPGR